jgi:uncharacterized protein
MLRTSSYTIYVDLPDDPETMLLVHGYAGTYDRVSRRVATYVRALEARPAPRPLYGEWCPEPASAGAVSAPSDETVRLLRRRGYLTELPVEQEEELFGRLVEKLHARDLHEPPAYIFMPTYDCNLRCAYCFQDHMRTEARHRPLLRLMSRQMADRIIAALPAIEADHGVVPGGGGVARDVGFFGGEPLLAANRETVEHVVRQLQALGETRFWAVTNATELAAYADLLGPQAITTLQITLDGPPREHDRRRIYADGSGSFARIGRNIELALAQQVSVTVRLNVDRNNVGDLPELADEIVARGWNGAANFSLYTAPITAQNDKTEARSTFSTWELDGALTELRQRHAAMAVIGRPDDRLKYEARRLFSTAANLPQALRSSFCSVHNRMYIFDAFGDIYACWERTGDERVRIGRLGEDGSIERSHGLTQTWRSRTVASNPVCRRCRYALHCGGGCAILALGRTGEFHANFCDGFQSRFRASVAEAYGEHVRGERLTVQQARVCDQ